MNPVRQASSAWPAVAIPTAVPAWITVDLDAIAANVAVLRAAAGSAGVMAVVKADAYGHGLVPSARAALRGGAEWLATAQLDEALQLRRAGIAAPVLSWLHTPGADFAAAIDAGIDLGVSAPWAVAQVAEAARATGRPARIHLKIDTGLARNGVTPADLPDLLPAIGRLVAEGAIEFVGAFSHFAYADAPEHPTVTAQEREFADALTVLERAGLPPRLRHLAGSAATLTNPRAAYDLVRPGLAVYGLSPVPDRSTSAQLGLRPAMTVSARLALAKDVPAGQGVSYGHEYVTLRDTRVVLVPIGYADGVPRTAGNRAPIAIGGRRLTIAGRVCMDQVVLDVGPDTAIEAGDVAVLFGPGDRGEPTAQDWAEATGTISYEIVTRMSARLPRSFTGEA